MTTTAPLADAEARARIRGDLDTTLFVEAAAGIKRQRIGVVLIHMGDDVGFGRNQRRRPRRHDLGRFEPMNRAKSRDDMNPFHRESEKPKIAQRQVVRGILVAPDIAVEQRLVIRLLNAAKQAEPWSSQRVLVTVSCIEYL